MKQREDLKAVAQKLFGDLADSYDSALDNVTLKQDRYWKKFLIDMAELTSGETVLDLACGTCVLEEELALVGCNVIGLDLSGPMIRRGQAKIKGIANLLRADAERLPLVPGSIDVVVSCYLPKYSDTDKLLAEITSALRPGGRVIVYDFSRPRGLFAPFHAFYVYGFLQILARVAKRSLGGLDYTFQKLPGIIRRTHWVESWRIRLRRGAFVNVGERALTGGVVTFFWATRAKS